MLKGVAAAAALRGRASALPAGPAQSGGRVVVGTWGGDYARLLTKNIEEPILKPKGIEVVQDQAGDAPRRAKMVAERRLPRGTVDIQGLSAANMFEMNEAGVVEQIDYSKIPNAKNLLPSDEVPLRHRAHLFRQRGDLQSQDDQPGPDRLQGLARSEVRQQDRLHRHPVPVDHDRGLAGRRPTAPA